MNPFAQLLKQPLPRLPRTPGVSVVVNGKRVSDVRQIDVDDAEDRARLIQAVRAAKAAAKYQQIRQDPVRMAKRKAWELANLEKRRAYQRAYYERTRDHQREQKTAWAKRTYEANAEKRRAATRAYYQRNRERILADKKAAAAAVRAAKSPSADRLRDSPG
jgi:hypothetical protein